jgi:hypothetical protein
MSYGLNERWLEIARKKAKLHEIYERVHSLIFPIHNKDALTSEEIITEALVARW